MTLTGSKQMAEGLLPLTDVQREIVRTAREFAANELAPHVAERDRTGEFSREVDRVGICHRGTLKSLSAACS